MVSKGVSIYPEDFVELKAMVKEEILRRGKPEGTNKNYSVGSLEKYASGQYDYEQIPVEGIKILNEHITKLIDPVNAVYKRLQHEDEANVVASELNNIITTITKLAEIPATAKNTEASGCSASCSGLCYTGCYSSCTSCTGGCSGSCSGSCSGGCSGGCSGCSGCGSGCSGGCSGCGGSCSNNCSGCSGSCSGGCQYTCSTSCDDGCDGCSDTCQGMCTNSCNSGCSEQCQGYCSGTCSVLCNDQAWYNA